MARMPGVQWVGPVHDNGVMSRWDVVCVHTIVGRAPAHAAHFSTNAAGTIMQSRDTIYRSAANLEGNPRVIAIENEDFGTAYGSWTGSNVPAFTEAQCEAIARICAWAHRAHGIPLVLCPDSRPTSRGIGYHRQGIDGNFGSFAYGGRVSGGEKWSSSFGKVCPGDRRIKQLIEVIIPRARVLAGGVAPAPENPTEDDMPYTPKELQDNVYAAVRNLLIDMNNGTNAGALGAVQGVIGSSVEPLSVKLDALGDALSDDEANIIAAVRQMGTGLTADQHAQILAQVLPGAVVQALVDLAGKAA